MNTITSQLAMIQSSLSLGMRIDDEYKSIEIVTPEFMPASGLRCRTLLALIN